MMKNRKSKRTYDIALSFAGADRDFVSEVSDYLKFFGVKVFYDTWEQHKLLGENLYSYLADIYEHKAEYAALFLSKHYIKRAWPKHELRYVQARALLSDRPYLLPIRLDSTNVPGIPGTTGYIDASKAEPSTIALLLLRRLGHDLKRGRVNEYLLEKDTTYRIFWNGKVKVNTKYTTIWLGNRPINRFHPSLWSPDGGDLNVKSFVVRDKIGKLLVEKKSQSKSSSNYTVYYRSPQQYGEVMQFEVSYECDMYYGDLLTECVDDFVVGVPTRRIIRKYIFPKNSKLKFFKISRKTGRRRVSQIYSSNTENGCPVIDYLYDEPEVGSKYEIQFLIER